MKFRDRSSILKEEHDHNFHSDVIYSQEFLGNQLEIHEKRHASALSAALRAAIPLHSPTLESSATTKPASYIASPGEPRTIASVRNRNLPKHLEPDAVAALHLSTAPQGASLTEG